ncbi:MAG: branched-chain amino acid ABC transporter permease [Deferrisomatales bacterium]
MSITLAGFGQQILVGLSKTTILFIVASGLSLVLGVLRIPNIFHGSLYMVGAFLAYTVVTVLGGGPVALFAAFLLAPLGVAAISLVVERLFLARLYEREHLMLMLFTFALAMVTSDLVKIVWGSDFRSISLPGFFQGSFSMGGLPIPRYSLFLLAMGPLVAVGLWVLTNKTKIGKVARAAAVDREMVGAIGINVSWVFASVFVIGCFLAGLGGALVAPTQNIMQGMDHSIIIEAFLIVIMGGLGARVFGLTDSLGVLIWPQFSIVFPYAAVIVVLLLRPTGLLKSTW